MNKPLISVIVPLYNKEKWVVRCVESIIYQSYQNIEILLINDGSTDDSLKVVSAIDDARIRIIDKPNGGVSSARNLGVDSAKGVYVAFLDADDKWHKEHLSALIKGFTNYKDAAIVANRFEEKVSTSEPDVKEKVPKEFNYTIEDYLFWLSENIFPIHIGSIMFKKSMLDAHNIRFHEHIKMGEDINLIIRVCRLGQCIVSDYVGFIYYRDDENSAMNSATKKAALVPLYFYGMDVKHWSLKDKEKVIKFLRKEYLKKAYQNRGLVWSNDEFSTKVGGGMEIGKISIVLYLIIRYTPQVLFSLYKQLR